MACFFVGNTNVEVTIPTFHQTDNYTVYHINIKIGSVYWLVHHRYSDFADLHEKLVCDYGLTKDILPPKKVIGNRDLSFIEKRRKALEVYLTTVVNFMKMIMPRELVVFLNFNEYDILFLLQDMALKLFIEGDSLLQSNKYFHLTPLEMYAISERLKLPCPTFEASDKRLDFSHVLDFCCQLSVLSIKGTDSCVGTSNINPNKLHFELSAFKVLEKLIIVDLPVSNIYSIGSLRETLTMVQLNYCKLKYISHFLMCDDLHKNVSDAGDLYYWKKLCEADFSHNEIEIIDESTKLMTNLHQLNLSFNNISTLDNLTSLPYLSVINLSCNSFVKLNDIHMKMGNIVSVDLSQNNITCLSGFSKLYSLESLNLSSNQISEVEEMKHLSNLPCLENLTLIENPVAIVVDYRVRVLEQFGKRASEICLDNEKSTQKELDTVAVLQAIRIVKEGRTPTFGSELAPKFPLTP